MKKYVSIEQMDIIDLIKDELGQFLIGNAYMKRSLPDKSRTRAYYDGKCHAYIVVMRFLNEFKILDDEGEKWERDNDD